MLSFYSIKDVKELYNEIDKIELPIIKSNKKIEYFNVPCSFDIETTSFYENEEKRAIMYIWSLGINGFMYYGRTWEEFINALDFLSEKLELNSKRRLVIYVHNLAFEFQFIRKLFVWDKVFATDLRVPVYAVTIKGIEFRCSYLLSGYSLENLGKGLTKYKIKKLMGNLDYSLLRHSKTPLTQQELAYCENDIAVVMAYIQEKIENNESIDKIPYTKTGYVRKYCKKYCYYNNGVKKKNQHQYYNYRQLMDVLQLTTEEYLLMKRAYQGGFTHANPLNSNQIYKQVSSYDFTSSYPSVMLTEKFPMSRGKRIEIENKEMFDKYLEKYCCIFNISFTNIRPKLWYDNPISYSKCRNVSDVVLNNGRVVSASYLETTLTEIDYKIIKEYYEWDNEEVFEFYRYLKGYLPRPLILSILDLYNNKTKLKNVEGKEVEYSLSKEMLNSVYGMCVTDIVRNEIEYDGDSWSSTPPSNYDKLIEKTNKSRNRFLFYGWGLYTTAYARKNLFTGISECKEDYIYADTDSLKILNRNKHLDYFNWYNKQIEDKLIAMCDYYEIDYEMIRPKTIKGVEKIIGVWDYEGTYKYFKTLGAKRYLYTEYGNSKTKYKRKNHLVVAGLGKKHSLNYLQKKGNLYETFNDGMYVSGDYTDKMTHTYIDDEKSGVMIDYLGTPLEYHEMSSVHLEKCEFTLSMSEVYLDFIFGLKLRKGGY